MAEAQTDLSERIDHYVLALSWSPTYCADKDPHRAPLQCGLDADRTFIVHGLWPNFADDRKEFCDSRQARPSRRTVQDILDLMPSRGLVNHQWRKHGSCSGLDPDAYFELVREAAEAVRIPQGLEQLANSIEARPQIIREAFVRSNPGLSHDDIYVRCRGDELIDVRICLSPSLDFRACPNVRDRRCRSSMLEIDPPR